MEKGGMVWGHSTETRIRGKKVNEIHWIRPRPLLKLSAAFGLDKFVRLNIRDFLPRSAQILKESLCLLLALCIASKELNNSYNVRVLCPCRVRSSENCSSISSNSLVRSLYAVVSRASSIVVARLSSS